jgi:hypothetical protein
VVAEFLDLFVDECRGDSIARGFFTAPFFALMAITTAKPVLQELHSFKVLQIEAAEFIMRAEEAIARSGTQKFHVVKE